MRLTVTDDRFASLHLRSRRHNRGRLWSVRLKRGGRRARARVLVLRRVRVCVRVVAGRLGQRPRQAHAGGEWLLDGEGALVPWPGALARRVVGPRGQRSFAESSCLDDSAHASARCCRNRAETRCALERWESPPPRRADEVHPSRSCLGRGSEGRVRVGSLRG